MLLKKSRCFLILAIALSAFFACKGESEAKQTINTPSNENTDTDLNSNSNSNSKKLKISEFKLEKLSELTSIYADQICDMQVDPENKESVLLWVKTKNAEDDRPVDRLGLWNKETQISLINFEQSIHPIVALSPFYNGNVYKVILRSVDTHVDYFKGHYLLDILDARTLNESDSPIQFTLKDLGTHKYSYVHKGTCGFFPVKLKNLPDSNLAALVRTEENLKLLNYDVSGKLKWSKVLQSKKLLINHPSMDSSQFADNHKGEIAVVFDLPDEQIGDFERTYQVSLNNSTNRSEEILVMFDENGHLLRVQDLQDLGSLNLTWIDNERLALVSAKRSKDQDKVQISVISKNPKEKIIQIPVDFESKLVSVHDIHSINEKRVLISGSVDFHQVDTSSVVVTGKAFVGVYDFEERKFVYTQKIASERNNGVTSVSEESSGVFLIATIEGPLTHDEDETTKLSIYRLSQ